MIHAENERSRPSTLRGVAYPLTEERLKAMHSLDSEGRLRAGEIETEQKRKKLLGAFAEELERKKLERGNLRLCLVAGA